MAGFHQNTNPQSVGVAMPQGARVYAPSPSTLINGLIQVIWQGQGGFVDRDAIQLESDYIRYGASLAPFTRMGMAHGADGWGNYGSPAMQYLQGEAGAPLLAAVQQSMAQIAPPQAPPLQVSWVNQQGQQVQNPGVATPPLQQNPNAPQGEQPPHAQAPAGGAGAAGGMSTTTMLLLGGGAFVAIMLLMKRKK